MVRNKADEFRKLLFKGCYNGVEDKCVSNAFCWVGVHFY